MLESQDTNSLLHITLRQWSTWEMLSSAPPGLVPYIYTVSADKLCLLDIILVEP